MRKTLVRLGIALAMALPVITLSNPIASADNGTVTITDTGFNPANITINLGGTITWTNSGSKVHNAQTKTAPTPFNTGGIGPGQAFPINFTVPGTYNYVSTIDCPSSGGASSTGFDCTTTATIAVVDNTLAYNSNPFPTPTPTSTPVPTTGPPQTATVNISPSGFDPPSVTIALGGSVSFVNTDNTATHTAKTTGGGNPVPFDTGGLAPGLTASFGFTIPGTYTYTSSVDCLGGASNPKFSCGPYQIIVSNQQSALAPGLAGPTPVAGTTATIDDVNGFTPAVLAIHPGQTVTWTNNGKTVHTVVSNPGYPKQFNSGGLAPGQSFSYTFNDPGTYGYHSDTEVTYAIDGMGNKVPQYKFSATVLSQ